MTKRKYHSVSRAARNLLKSRSYGSRAHSTTIIVIVVVVVNVVAEVTAHGLIITQHGAMNRTEDSVIQKRHVVPT